MVIRFQVVFRKDEPARFLSHLDLMATLECSVRRAQLPVALSEGFNPRPRLALAAPLPLGHTGEQELLDLELLEPLTVTEVRERLQAALPEGLVVLSVEPGPEGRRSASRVVGAVYRVLLPGQEHGLAHRVEELLGRVELPQEEEREGRIRTRDLRPYIRSLEAVDPRTLAIEVRLDGSGTVRPEQILDLLGVPRDGVKIVRESLNLK